MLKELLLVTATTLALAACSSTPQRVARDNSGQAATTHCVRSASRLPEAPCASPGSSYSSDELRDTGQTDASSALKMLDPRVTGH